MISRLVVAGVFAVTRATALLALRRRLLTGLLQDCRSNHGNRDDYDRQYPTGHLLDFVCGQLSDACRCREISYAPPGVRSMRSSSLSLGELSCQLAVHFLAHGLA